MPEAEQAGGRAQEMTLRPGAAPAGMEALLPVAAATDQGQAAHLQNLGMRSP